ncbi:hypothetical protein CFP56_043339, partial [Quercus suber]
MKKLQDAEVIEALAIRRAIKFAIETSFNCVIIENTAETTFHIGHIIDDVKHLSKAMKSCEFHHTKREANQIGHTLARNAIHVDTEMAWLEEIPPCVYDFTWVDVINDVKHLSKAMKSCEFHHTKREANQIGHTLARNAIHVDTEMAWLEEIPPCVYD